MEKNESYSRYYHALLLQRLINTPNFPPEFLADDVLTSALGDLVTRDTYDYLMRNQEKILEAYGSRHQRLRSGGGQRRGLALGRVTTLINRDLDDLRNSISTEDRETAPLGKLLQCLQEIFQLDAQELEVLRYFSLLALDSGLEEVMDDITLTPMRRNYPAFVARLLGLPVSPVRSRLGQKAPLRKLGILEAELVLDGGRDTPELCDFVKKMLTSDAVSGESLVESLYLAEPSSSLQAGDYSHLGTDLENVARLLKGGWKEGIPGVNILFYGAPGLGKTEMARVIAGITSANIYALPRHGEDGDTPSVSERRMALDLFHRISQGIQRPLLVVDEAEALLEEEGGLLFLFRRGRSGVSDKKAWLTEALERNAVPTIYIVNQHRWIDDAVRRRFAYSVRFPAIPKETGLRIWGNILRRAGERFALAQPVLREMAGQFELSPGHIAKGVETWVRITGRRNPDPQVLRQILSQSMRLSKEKEPASGKLRALDEHYDPSLLHLEGGADPARLARIIRRFYRETNETGGRKSIPGQFTLLFHGPSGAGKTELAKYLADCSGHDLQVERMSDLLSKWVGESEQNIAAAFTRATDAGNILLLDEFDSLAFDRRGATRSWEISQTNEMLQQIENFRGVLIACTNLLQNLDPAMSRRFTHKIGFGGIRDNRRREAVQTYFSEIIAGRKLSTPLQARLKGLPSLYPGDLRAVRQKLDMERMLGRALAPEDVVAALEHESAYRKGEQRPIGFK